MKITLNDKWILADDTLDPLDGGIPTSGKSGSRTHDEQIDHYTRGDQVYPHDRLNVQTTFSIPTSRAYDSPGLAEEEMLRWIEEMPRWGIVEFETKREGFSSHVRYLLASVQITNISITGATAFFTYRITGGQLSTTKPELEEEE